MAFLYVQPCLRSLSADVGVDTTGLTSGTHHVVVTLLDAAGNSATVLDRDVVVSNAVAPTGGGMSGSGGASAGGASGALGGGGAQGAPNGTNASAQATLALGWKGARGARLSAPYGRSETVVGRLLAPGGAPIAGALVEASATPAYGGAHTASLASPVTAANGTFSLRLAGGVSSRTLTFAYRAHSGDAQPAATARLSLSVRAELRLSISPRVTSVGHRIRFSGRLLGGPYPHSGKLLVLEARSVPGPWIEFDVVRSGRGGRFHASYRFRLPGPAVYRFRAVSQPEGDYPYAHGTSNTVVVHER
jgi:hypothetical protein